MSWHARCAAFLSEKCFRDQLVGFRNSSLCFGSVLDLSCRAWSCLLPCFPKGAHAPLNHLVSAAIDGTVALAHCLNQHCKCLLNAFRLYGVFPACIQGCFPPVVIYIMPLWCCLHNLISLHHTGLCYDSGLSISLCNDPIDNNPSHSSTPADS